MKKRLLIICLLAILAGLSALDLNLTVDAARWQDRSLYPISTEDWGAPALPFYPVKVLLPYGHKISSVDIELGASRTLHNGIALDYVRQAQPVSLPSPDTTLRNPDIYNSSTPYPQKDYQLLGTQFYRGMQLAIINVYPFKYIGIESRVLIHEQIRISLQTSFDPELAEYQAGLLSVTDPEQLTMICVNPAEQSSYNAARGTYRHNPTSRLIDLSTPRKMIIVTDASRQNWFTDYASWRGSQGISTGIYTTQDIYNAYGGVDNAAKVRSFIIDAYQSWANSSTPLEYVILGGDDEVVPERGSFGRVGNTVDQRMPTDLYYGCLDGTWNANNNTVWGETSDNVDMIPELHVGRFPAESISEFNNIFRKIQYYVNNDTFSNNIAIMYGENLNNNPLTWGGDYKDDVAQYIPDTYFLETHYQRDGTYNESIVWNSINQGVNVMNHMGHANETFLMGQGNNTIEQLQNTEYGFLYSQGCYPAAFDQRTSGDGESIGEHLLTAYGAVMAFVGNTRYGWYMPGGIDGASQYYDRQFFIGIYNQAILELGKALTYSRLQNLNSALSSDVMRWCYYEQVLFGDPSIAVKFPDLSLPLLSLQSYSFDDVEGDNDGMFNPGEIIRFHPVITNNPNWGTAHNVHVQISGLPNGAEVLGGCPVYDTLAPGAQTPSDSYVRIQLPQNMGYGSYTFKVALTANHPVTGLSIGTRVFQASLDVTLMDSRFPWDCQTGSKSAPLVISGADNEIVYQDTYGRMWLIDDQGNSSANYGPAEQQNIMRSTAMGLINNDTVPDIVIASRSGLVYAMDTNGTIVFSYQAPTSFLFTPVLADLNGDGRHEIILGGLDGKIYALKADSSLMPGFPVELNATFNSELAVAVFAEGQSPDIIAGTVAGTLYRISAQGTVYNGFPINLGSSVTGSPSILRGEIYAGTSSQIYKILASGQILASAQVPASLAGGAVFGNIIENGRFDLAFVTINGYLFAMDSDLNTLPGFPVNLGDNFTCPPLLADLTGDQQPEIIAHSYINSVFIHEPDGSSLDGFPFITSYNGATPGTLVDFDNNGYYKLVTGYSTGVMMLNLRRPVGSQAQWLTYRGGLLRQGSQEATGFVSNNESSSPALGLSLSQNYPNPFRTETRIDYQIGKSGDVRVDIFNLRGQLVRSLRANHRNTGTHSLLWDGRDQDGNPAASGVYAYRLTAPEGSITRKLLIIK